LPDFFLSCEESQRRILNSDNKSCAANFSVTETPTDNSRQLLAWTVHGELVELCAHHAGPRRYNHGAHFHFSTNDDLEEAMEVPIEEGVAGFPFSTKPGSIGIVLNRSLHRF
jgi:hypothetical protein